jgi:hypothetical protein
MPVLVWEIIGELMFLLSVYVSGRLNLKLCMVGKNKKREMAKKVFGIGLRII